MNVPAGSAPTAAISATLRPSRAAATAVIEADPPITSEMPSTSFSCWPKAGVTSSPRTSTSGLQSPMTTRSRSRPQTRPRPAGGPGSSGPGSSGPGSGGDNFNPGDLEQDHVGGGDAGIGDQHVDLGR